MKKILIRLIRRDCARTMWSTWALYTVRELLAAIASVVTANALGGLADAVFSLQPDSAVRAVITLALCILVNSAILPCFETLCNFCMLSGALRHDRIILSRWLDKRYLSAVQTDVGEVAARLEDDPIDYRYYWMQLRVNGLVSPLTLVLVAWQMVMVHTGYAFFVGLLALVKFAVPIAVRKREAAYDRKMREYRADARAREQELTAIPAALRLLGLAERWCELLDRRFSRHYKETLREKTAFAALVDAVKTLADTVLTLLVLLVGAVFVADGTIGVGSVAAMLGYFGVFGGGMEQLAFIVRKRPLLREVEKRMLLFYEDAERTGGESVDDVADVSAHALAFAYGEEPLFAGLEFTLKTGEKLAVVGANGTGKSTVVKLLTGLVDPTDGAVVVSGKDLCILDLTAWRTRLAVAMQDPWLAEGTVAENVRMANPAIPEEHLSELLTKTGLADLAETEITASEVPLSGGEKQRVGLARAIVRSAPILVLDEPSNHLDEEGMAVLKALISNYCGTVLMVTHDAELTELADRVLQLEK